MSESREEYYHRRRNRHSIFFPLLLIIVGVVLFLNTFGLIQGGYADILVRVWPVLLIAAGLDGLYMRNGYVGSIIIVGIGTIFLLGNFDLLIISGWDIAIRFWPIILVAWGLDIVIGKRSVFSAIIGVLLGAGLMAGIIWLSINPIVDRVAENVERIHQELEDVDGAKVQVTYPAGNLEIAGGAKGSELISAILYGNRFSNVSKQYDVKDDYGIYQLAASEENLMLGRSSFNKGWDIALNETIPLDIETEMILGELSLDMSNLFVKDFSSELIVGKVVVSLPEDAYFEGFVSVSVGEIVIYVPRDLPLRINADIAITGLSVPGDFVRHGDFISSPAVEGTKGKVRLGISNPVGSVRIEYLD